MSTNHIDETLDGSPYSLSAAAGEELAMALGKLHERVENLRSAGQLTNSTLRRYYGSTRFEQVAESNAIEGSTLSVGETELAIVKGVTLTGHDPGYVRDAIALDKALSRLTEMAREHSATDIEQVKELHGLILTGRQSAGMFRNVPVRISGSDHRPPKDWKGVMDQMDAWEKWSLSREQLSPVLRGAVLHAWLAHIHPFTDGNGRLARAITNLELIRGGYPPIIIRRNQDRDRYVSALQLSDRAGDLGQFVDLVIDRFDGALLGLESAASEMEGYDPAVARMRRAQERKLEVWNTSVGLLFQILKERLATTLEQADGHLEARLFRNPLGLEEYISLCSEKAVSRSWAFVLKASGPGLRTIERLAWIGYRTQDLRVRMGAEGVAAPSLFWSKPNEDGYPPWVRCDRTDAPGVIEMSTTPETGDNWHALDLEGNHISVTTSLLAQQICASFVALISK